MKIYIRSYLTPMIGSYTTDIISIPSNNILVSELKDILYEKYGVSKSQQRLTYKIANQMVTLTNDWPLSFFFIRENSKIYLEFIQSITKSEDINRKIQSNPKSKYLKSLGLFQQYSSNQIVTIPEIQNEDLEDYTNIDNNNPSSSNKMTQSFREEDIKTLINSAIKKNHTKQFYSLMKQNINVYQVNEKWKGGWAPIHYAAFNGYTEILSDLINNFNADINLVSDDGWTALHLACFKGHIDIVRLLMSNGNTNIDMNLPKIGTALHCACKKNFLKIVSLLLLKANGRIKDEDGFTPIELTTDKNIKSLINKILNPNQRKKIEKKETPEKFSFLKTLKYIPPKPPKVIGYTEKLGLFFKYSSRYIEIDPNLGCFRKFENKTNYPKDPLATISLINIVSCKKCERDKNCMELIAKSKEIYRFKSRVICEKWIDLINRAVIYFRFWKNLEVHDAEVTEFRLHQGNYVVEIDSNTGEFTKYEEKKEEIRDNKVKEKQSSNKGNNSNNNNQRIQRRRSNPFTQTDKEEKLLEDSTLTKGITFESFEILSCIGAGTFGKVFKVRCHFNGEIYAMKVLNKNNLIRNHQLRYAVTECNVIKQSESPFIITLHYSFQTPDNLYMVIDYCPGGDMNYFIQQNIFEEEDAKFFIAELLLGIEYLHSLDIIYRDLKPENILIAKDGHIKLTDFGLAKEGISDIEITQSFCGSPAYLSPEMISKRGVGKSADIYGIGAVLYEMICGAPPFFASDMMEMYKNITNSNLMLHEYFSPELKDLLTKLLNKDPKRRIGVKDKEEIKSHPFFEGINWKKLANKEIKPPINLAAIKESMEGKSFYNYKKTIFKDKDYNDSNKYYNRVKQFTFVRSVSTSDDNNNNNTSDDFSSK